MLVDWAVRDDKRVVTIPTRHGRRSTPVRVAALRKDRDRTAWLHRASAAAISGTVLSGLAWIGTGLACRRATPCGPDARQSSAALARPARKHFQSRTDRFTRCTNLFRPRTNLFPLRTN